MGAPASLGSAAPGAAPSKGGGWDTHLRAPPWEWAAWAEGPVTVWPPPAWPTWADTVTVSPVASRTALSTSPARFPRVNAATIASTGKRTTTREPSTAPSWPLPPTIDQVTRLMEASRSTTSVHRPRSMSASAELEGPRCPPPSACRPALAPTWPRALSLRAPLPRPSPRFSPSRAAPRPRPSPRRSSSRAPPPCPPRPPRGPCGAGAPASGPPHAGTEPDPAGPSPPSGASAHVGAEGLGSASARAHPAGSWARAPRSGALSPGAASPSPRRAPWRRSPVSRSRLARSNSSRASRAPKRPLPWAPPPEAPAAASEPTGAASWGEPPPTRPTAPSSAPSGCAGATGTRMRPTRSSNCRRGEVAPVIDRSASSTRSAARDKPLGPQFFACNCIRSNWSAGASERTSRAPSPATAIISRSRRRWSRSSTKRLGSCPDSTMRSTTLYAPAPSPPARASTDSSSSAESVYPRSATAVA